MDPQRQGFRKTPTNLTAISHIFLLTFLWAGSHPSPPATQLWNTNSDSWVGITQPVQRQSGCGNTSDGLAWKKPVAAGWVLRFLAWPCALSSLCLPAYMNKNPLWLAALTPGAGFPWYTYSSSKGCQEGSIETAQHCMFALPYHSLRLNIAPCRNSRNNTQLESATSF